MIVMMIKDELHKKTSHESAETISKILVPQEVKTTEKKKPCRISKCEIKRGKDCQEDTKRKGRYHFPHKI